MAKKSLVNIDKYLLGKYPSLRKKDPYRLVNLYLSLSDPYRLLTKMRRGYKSSAKARSYSPSRRKGGSSSAPRYRSRTTYRPKMRYQPQPPYKPQPRPRAIRSSDKPWTEPTKSRIQHIRYQPDIEKMLKKLEKRFDEKLEQEVLERMETEFEEPKAALTEKSKAYSKTQENNIEAGPEEEAENQLETTELIDIDNQKTSTEAKAELPIRDSSYDVEEKNEWPREQIENEESVDPNEQIEEIGPVATLQLELTPEANRQFETVAPVKATLEPVATIEPEQPSLEQMMGDAQFIESTPFEPIDLLEQSVDLESIFEQIEPLDIELMQPFELMILPEIMPLEDTVEADATEAGYY
jgi:hypothetical protein